MGETNRNYITFKDVIYLDGDLWKYIKEELMLKGKELLGKGVQLVSYPLYQRMPNGVIVPNSFLSRKPSAIYFFDVTDANEETKLEIMTKYQVEIHELPIPKQNVKGYMALLPIISQIYTSGELTQEELNSLGHDFKYVEFNNNGYKITKSILIKRLKGHENIYLNIDFSKLSKELENKVLGEVEHFIIKDNGYYNNINVGEEVKIYTKKCR